MRLSNTTIATLDDDGTYGLIEQGTIVIEEGLIAWVGFEQLLPSQYAKMEVLDLAGRLITPAFIDCHTHVVHGGHRAVEFEFRRY